MENLVELLLETCTLTRAVSQVIQARSPDHVVPVYDYFFDARGAQHQGRAIVEPVFDLGRKVVSGT